jgi:hypothetical protein
MADEERPSTFLGRLMRRVGDTGRRAASWIPFNAADRFAGFMEGAIQTISEGEWSLEALDRNVRAHVAAEMARTDSVSGTPEAVVGDALALGVTLGGAAATALTARAAMSRVTATGEEIARIGRLHTFVGSQSPSGAVYTLADVEAGAGVHLVRLAERGLERLPMLERQFRLAQAETILWTGTASGLGTAGVATTVACVLRPEQPLTATSPSSVAPTQDITGVPRLGQ